MGPDHQHLTHLMGEEEIRSNCHPVQLPPGSTATRFLKKWSGLAKCADTTRLYLLQAQGSLPSFSLLYQKQQVYKACELLASRDPAVRYTSTLETKREEALQRPTHRPMLTARDALAIEPGMTKRALIKRAKSIVCKKDAGKRLQHALSLECQGRVFRCCEDSAASVWSSVVQKLPSELLKFSLNAVQDTCRTMTT